MTAEVIVLAHEAALDYDEIRASLIESYAPATNQELMLVDQIAAGYWRTIRARRFETALFNEQAAGLKRTHRKDPSPEAGHDDSVCVEVLQEITPKQMENYFRYDGTISRDYYRAINALERMQAGRRRKEDRDERKRKQEARELERITNHPDPDTIAARSPEPPAAFERGRTPAMAVQATATKTFTSIGFVSSQSLSHQPASIAVKPALPRTLQKPAFHRTVNQ